MTKRLVVLLLPDDDGHGPTSLAIPSGTVGVDMAVPDEDWQRCSAADLAVHYAEPAFASLRAQRAARTA